MKKQNGDTVLYIFFALLLVVIIMLGLYYAKVSTKQQSTSKTDNALTSTQQLTPRPPSPTPTILKVPFDYEVIAITTDSIELNGLRGKLLLPKDPSKVKVYQGRSKDVPLELSSVKVGQKAMLEADPGKTVWLYIVQ